MMKSTLRRSIHWSMPAAVLAVLATVFSPGPVQAAVTVRVESRPAPVAPASSPIKVYVTVTDATTGLPVGGLLASDFTVKLDGVLITTPPDFSLPPAQNGTRNTSVVFAMDYSPSTADPATLKAMQDAVIAFINSMTPGDYAAIVKFNGTLGASVVQPFTLIDGAERHVRVGRCGDGTLRRFVHKPVRRHRRGTQPVRRLPPCSQTAPRR